MEPGGPSDYGQFRQHLVGFGDSRRCFKSLPWGCGRFARKYTNSWEKRRFCPYVWVAGGYFGWVGLSVGNDIYLVVFRVASLDPGTEEAQAFSVFRKLELLHRRGVIEDGNVLKYVNAVESSRDRKSLEDAYKEARSRISQVNQADLTDATDLQMLNSAEGNDLVRSKQLGMVRGVAVIFAGMTITISYARTKRGHSHAFSSDYAHLRRHHIPDRWMRDQRIDEPR